MSEAPRLQIQSTTDPAVLEFTFEKLLHIHRPAQFKFLLFKSQLYNQYTANAGDGASPHG